MARAVERTQAQGIHMFAPKKQRASRMAVATPDATSVQKICGIFLAQRMGECDALQLRKSELTHGGGGARAAWEVSLDIGGGWLFDGGKLPSVPAERSDACPLDSPPSSAEWDSFWCPLP